MNNNDDNFVKIFFELEPEDDDWPPCAVESIWAIHLENDLYQLDNIPFYVKGVSYKDIIIAIKSPDGILEFQKVSKASGHSTIRVYLFNNKEEELFIKQIKNLNCEIEKTGSPLLAIHIPTETKYNDILDFLKNTAEDLLDYEEGCISEYHSKQKIEER